MSKRRKYREIVRILREYDRRLEFESDRGKGSERIIYHPDINGRPESIPVKCHGENTELDPGMIRAIIRRFSLPPKLL